VDDFPALVYALPRFRVSSESHFVTINSTLNPSSFAQSALIRLSLIFLVGCLSAFNAQVRISRFTPQPDSTSYRIGASRMINDRYDWAVEDPCQNSVEDYADQIQQAFDHDHAKFISLCNTPVKALALAIPLVLSLRAPPPSA
jgi:hypothetical protein